MRYAAKLEDGEVILTNKWTGDPIKVIEDYFIEPGLITVPSKTFVKNTIHYYEIANLEVVKDKYPEYFI